MKRTFKAILAEYGAIALVVYLTIFFVVLGAFWVAVLAGWQPEGIFSRAGAFGVAYLATKVTQPVRIAATLFLTPVVARVVERFFPKLARGNGRRAPSEP